MKEKNNYFETLKVFACVAVIAIHATGFIVVNRNLSFTTNWWGAIVYNSIGRWAVPIFIMISGALLLEKEREVNLKKRIIRIIIPLLFWGIFFYLFNLYAFGQIQAFSIYDMVSGLLMGTTSYHMWYLYMLLGLYLSLPIIKIFINSASKNNIEYFMGICFVVSGILPLITKFLGIDVNLKVTIFGWEVGYFVLGYYLNNYRLNKVIENGIYLTGFLSIFITIFGTAQLYKSGSLDEFFLSSGSITCILMSMAIFLLAKNFLNKKDDIIEILSSNTFGIYLIHPFFLTIIRMNVLGIDLSNITGNAIIDIPIVVFLAFMGSCLLSIIFRKIKYLKRVVS
ncbi:acyltransferase [Clostridium sp. 'White wine YQ']|uniref:acyltransferase n=1 Tax=Clostridium sp. 'White wine YQ' TaxID=3027474 RepID=UPI002364FF14|nr:acyltransferase family protein [Clostridium sp. 'White wine YQ']MDD7794103.1 acyltransferase family protein [Clostridium sp. 'White wine YQ']